MWCSGKRTGGAQQRKLTCDLRRPPGPDPGSSGSGVAAQSAACTQHSERRHMSRVGITSPPVLTRWGSTHLCLRGRQFLRCAVFLAPGTTGQRPQATRPANAAGFFCVGMGGMGEGGRVRKMGRGGHGSGQERVRWVRMKGRVMKT